MDKKPSLDDLLGAVDDLRRTAIEIDSRYSDMSLLSTPGKRYYQRRLKKYKYIISFYAEEAPSLKVDLECIQILLGRIYPD